MEDKMSEKSMQKADILMIDDNPLDCELAREILGGEYHMITVDSGQNGLQTLNTCEPQLILLDLHMQGQDGEEIMDKLREHPQWSRIPVILLTEDAAPETEKICFEAGAADFIVKPFVETTLKGRVGRMIELYGLRRNLEEKLEEKSRLLEKVSLSSIMAIANTIDAKDTYTSGHSLRVAKCAEAIARELGWSDEEVKNIYHIGLLHDIGKIGVPDSILNKPSRLSEEEFAQIKKHPVIGGEILKNIRMIPGVADGALYHHERYDGKGYPFGIQGEDIPLCARIIAIADTYDAMTSNRIYRAKLPDSKVIAEFERCSGTQFDPKLAALFVKMMRGGFHIEKQSRRKNDDTLSGEAAENLSDRRNELSRVLSEYGNGKGSLDVLTGLSNRSDGESRITSLLSMGSRGALLVVDLDNFKNINDTYGHLVGDKVLKQFAETLKTNTSEQDVACRLGGDEFVIFLTDMVQREEIGERIRTIMDVFSVNIEEIGLRDASHISVGIALSPADGRNFSALHANADKALYYVKKSGKNAYSFFRDARQTSIQNNPDTDLDHIRYMIEGGMNREAGAYKVQYDEFKNLYTYLSRCVKRKGQLVQTVLYTLGSEGREDVDNVVYEEAMAALEVAAAYSLRMVDVGSRYSSLQFIVILVDTNIENGRMVAERVIKQFYKIYSGAGITLSYDIQTMVVNNA